MSEWSDSFLTSGSLVVFIIVFLSILVVKKIHKFVQFHKFIQSLPGDHNYSILYGNLHELPKEYEDVLSYTQEYMINTKPELKRFWLGPFEALIILFSPTMIRDVIRTGAPKSRGFGGGYEHSIPWLGESVLTANGTRWYRDRRLINNAFHTDILKNYMTIFNSASDTLMNIIGGYADKGESFESFHVISLCLLDIITKTTMSLDLNAQTTKHPYVKATKKLAAIWSLRNKTIHLWPELIFRLSKSGREFFAMCKYVHQVDSEMIAKRRHIMMTASDKDNQRRLDFLDLLLRAKDENGSTMTEQEIRENVDAIMFAGHDTGSSTMSWFLYQMALNPKHQQKIQEEVDQLMSTKEDETIEVEDLGSLPHLAICLKESMRVNPAVPTISRRVTQDTKIGDITIPAHTVIAIPIIYLHRNPEFWDKPLEFIPERFSPENVHKILPFTYLPFSAGSRNCAGQHFAQLEIKSVLARLLHKFEFELDATAPPVSRVCELIMKSKNGIWLKAKRRRA